MTKTDTLAKIDKSVTFVPVTSTSIASFAAPTGKSKDLFVKFKGGNTYRYKNVDAATVEGLTNALSKGAYFSKNIKDKFVTEQVSS